MRDPRHTKKEIDRLRFSMMQAREKAGKSQNDMAKVLGVHKNTVSNWENGYSVPDYLDVIKWFETLNQPIDSKYIFKSKNNIREYVFLSETDGWLAQNSEKWLPVNKNIINRLYNYYSKMIKWKERINNEKQET